jgi:hypothetical protein
VSTRIVAPETSGRAGDAVDARVEVDDPELGCWVLLGLLLGSSEPRLTSVEVHARPDGAALDPETVRALPLARYLVLATNQLRTSGPRVRTPDAPSSGAADAEDLDRVARTYREALASADARSRLAPTAAVARAFGVDRTAAGRLVARARREGLLHPALPRRPGEVIPGPPPTRDA